MCGLSGARAGASGPGERGKCVRGDVDLPESEDEGWGKGEVNEVSGRVEETSSGEQKNAVRVPPECVDCSLCCRDVISLI